MADDKLTTTTPNAVIPFEDDDLISDAGRGTENIGPDDVRPPRLLICQAGSPQRKTDDPKQIKGLQELDLFNSLTGDIYGRAVNFIVIQTLEDRWIEFNDFDEGGGVKDFNVPRGDPRTQWTNDDQGNRVPPKATQFYDYLVWLPEQQEICVLSMKKTQIKVALQLNGLLTHTLNINGRLVPNPPSWARTFALETKMEKDTNYSWGGFNLRPAGITPRETRNLCRSLADTYASRRIVVETDETDAAERQVREAPSMGGREKIPF